MPGNDLTVVGDKDWIVKAEPLDRCCDLLDLNLAVAACVSGIGLQ
jgi:hypothetical protein